MRARVGRFSGNALLLAASAEGRFFEPLLTGSRLAKTNLLAKKSEVTGFCDGAKTVAECDAEKQVCKANCDASHGDCKRDEERCKQDIHRCKEDRNHCRNSCGGRWRQKRRCKRNCNHRHACGRSWDCRRKCGWKRGKCKARCPPAYKCKMKAAACGSVVKAKEVVANTGFGAMLEMAMKGMEIESKPAYSQLFPEPNGVYETGYDYKANPWLLSTVRYQLAVTMAGYDFSSALAGGGEEYGSNFQPVTPRSVSDPAKYCGLGSETADAQYKAVKTWNLKKGTHDTQGSAYVYEDAKQVIVTMNFRGSETPSFETPKENFVQSLSQLRDWVGTDFVFFPVKDKICRKDNVQIHRGFRQAYRHFVKYGKDNEGLNWIQAVKKLLKEKKKDGKELKMMISGHSLGGALAALATYDSWCNKHFHKDLGYSEDAKDFPSGPFTVTYGEAFPFWGLESIDEYAATVPLKNRVRVNTCGQRGEVFGGDTVGSVTNFYADEDGGWRHTSDGDFQCAWVSRTAGDSSCVGLPGTFLCHLLDRYLEGTMNACPTDTLSDAEKCPKPPRTDMTGFCQGEVPVGPDFKGDMPKFWFVEYFKTFKKVGQEVWKAIRNPGEFAKSQMGKLKGKFGKGLVQVDESVDLEEEETKQDKIEQQLECDEGDEWDQEHGAVDENDDSAESEL